MTWWRRRRAGLWLAVVVLLAGARPATPAGVLEDQVRAEFIERFTRFVDWPAGTLPSGGRFRVCVVGASPVTPFLTEIAGERPIKDRPADVVTLARPFVVAGCHLLLIGTNGGTGGVESEVVAAAAALPILTVAHEPGAAGRGVMINFIRKGDVVRFEINRSAAQRAGLEVSSKLLRLADLVGDQPAPTAGAP